MIYVSFFIKIKRQFNFISIPYYHYNLSLFFCPKVQHAYIGKALTTFDHTPIQYNNWSCWEFEDWKKYLYFEFKSEQYRAKLSRRCNLGEQSSSKDKNPLHALEYVIENEKKLCNLIRRLSSLEGSSVFKWIVWIAHLLVKGKFRHHKLQ